MPNLNHLVPDKRVGTKSSGGKYIPRRLPGFEQPDVEVLATAVRQNWNVLKLGPTGNGKTSAIQAVCADNEWPLAIVNCNGMTTVEDLVGQVLPTESADRDATQLIDRVANARQQTLIAKSRKDGEGYLKAQLEQTRAELELDVAYKDGGSGLEWHDGVLVSLMKGSSEHEHTVLLADEINFGPAKVLSVINGVTDDRRQLTLAQHKGEVIQAHAGFAFMAAMNPNYEGTRPLNKALRDRFHLTLSYDYDEEIEAQLIPNDRLRGLAKKLRDMHAKEELLTPTSTRGLLHFMEVEAILGTGAAIESFVSTFEEDERAAVRESMTLHLRGGSGTKGAGIGTTEINDPNEV